MLTRLIVISYVWPLEAALWFAIALAAVVGYHISVLIMSAAGAVFAPELTWKLLGALIFPAITFFILAIVAGPILILIDVRQAVRKIDARLGRKEDFERPQSSERREPSI